MFRGRTKPAPIDTAKLAAAVRAKRGGRTLADVGAEISLNPSTVSLIENERLVPSIDVFVQLCEWLEMPMDYFTIKKTRHAA